VQENTRPAQRLVTVAAIALVAAAIGAFAWLSSGGVADAAGTGGSNSSVQTQPVQSGEQAAPDGARGDHDGRPCPEGEGGAAGQGSGGAGESGGSGDSGQQQAPSESATPDTEL
jgi:hypothetical protein